MKKTAALISLSLLSIPVFAEDGQSSGILPKVDKPIADTYEPLDGASWNHRRSEELKTLREYQKQEKEKASSDYEAQRRKALEAKIQAPDPGATPASRKPQISESDNGLRISDPN